MPEATTCGICGKPAELRNGSHPGYVEGYAFAVYHCSGCGAAFALPRVETDPIYERIYGQADRIPGYARYVAYAREVGCRSDPLGYLASREEAYWAVARVLAARQAGCGRALQVLDVGCGMGYLTHAISCAGYNVTGCDISARAIAHARERFGGRFEEVDFGSLAQSRPTSQDVVLLVEMIEHVWDPLALVRDALALIRPGGALVVTTPNRSLYPPSTLWQTELPPVHCWWLTEKAVGSLARATGCRHEIVDFSDFYRTHPCVVSVRPGQSSLFNQPVLAADGSVRESAQVPGDVGAQERPESLVRRVRLLPFVRPVIDRARGLQRCGRRGIILCAVLTKET